MSASVAPANRRPGRPRRVADDTARWSARRTLTFIVLTCGGFWLFACQALQGIA